MIQIAVPEESIPDPQPKFQFVIKATKFCNLRCTYCYEYEHLADKEFMSASSLERLFNSIASARRFELGQIEFVWHGGEPLLLGSLYYREARVLQKTILARYSIHNSCQTNATTLSPSILRYLAEGEFFDEIGVSYDPFGGQRLLKNGMDASEMIVEGMNKLRSADVNLGAITVLSRSTLPHLKETYSFFDEHMIGVRFLPYYLSVYPGQATAHQLSTIELADAWWQLFLQWSTSPHATPVEPISEYIEYALRYIYQKPFTSQYTQQSDEALFLINLDGNVFGASSNYEPESIYGNAFNDDFDSILESKARHVVNQASQDYQSRFCSGCSYVGYCPGQYAAEATAVMKSESSVCCSVRLFLDRAVPYLS